MIPRNGTNCRFVDYKYRKCGHYIYFHSCPDIGNSLSVSQKVHDFDIETKHLITLLK